MAENKILSVALCKDTLEAAIGEVGAYIPQQVIESTFYYLKEYERLKKLVGLPRSNGQVIMMAENKMAKVAAMFGKKLNEPITIKGERYVFGEKGFGHGNEHGVACHVPGILERLLTGQVKIDE